MNAAETKALAEKMIAEFDEDSTDKETVRMHWPAMFSEKLRGAAIARAYLRLREAGDNMGGAIGEVKPDACIALARQEKERADVLARKLDAADKLAVAVGKLPITGGPVWEFLRAYREASSPTPGTIPAD